MRAVAHSERFTLSFFSYLSNNKQTDEQTFILTVGGCTPSRVLIFSKVSLANDFVSTSVTFSSEGTIFMVLFTFLPALGGPWDLRRLRFFLTGGSCDLPCDVSFSLRGGGGAST